MGGGGAGGGGEGKENEDGQAKTSTVAVPGENSTGLYLCMSEWYVCPVFWQVVWVRG